MYLLERMLVFAFENAAMHDYWDKTQNGMETKWY